MKIGSLRRDDGYARERQAEVKHKNTGLPSVFIHPSNLGGKLLFCRLTENVACYSFIFLLEIRFVNFSPGLFQEYLFYTMQFIS